MSFEKMGEGAVVGSGSEITDNARTLVLVGRRGDGKSSTGNSILGRKAFKSMASSVSVTTACELGSTVLENGRTLNVIDTPEFFDFSNHGAMWTDFSNCIKMAKDGIHAVVVVLSVRTRFSLEVEAAIKSLRLIFGSKISDYMILVYTAGDLLEEEGETLDDYLGRDCPEPLKETLLMCENRCVLFDNRTKDPCKKSKQVNELCWLVDKVVVKNTGKPYYNELFLKMENETLKGDQREVEIKESTEMSESQLREIVHKLEVKVAKEQVARLEAEAAAKAAQMALRKEMDREMQRLDKALREEAMELRKPCPIL